MKVMFRRCLIMALAIIMAFGLAIPAFAAGQPVKSFSDVPKNH